MFVKLSALHGTLSSEVIEVSLDDPSSDIKYQLMLRKYEDLIDFKNFSEMTETEKTPKFARLVFRWRGDVIWNDDECIEIYIFELVDIRM